MLDVYDSCPNIIYGGGVAKKDINRLFEIDKLNGLLVGKISSDIEKIDSNVSRAIEAFRNGTIDVVPGGGGKYGEILLDKPIIKPKNEKVITLDNF